jgi:hypothetical protein
MHGEDSVRGDQVLNELGIRGSSRCRPLLRKRWRRNDSRGGEADAQQRECERLHRHTSILVGSYCAFGAAVPVSNAGRAALEVPAHRQIRRSLEQPLYVDAGVLVATSVLF